MTTTTTQPARPADVPGLATVLGFQEDGAGGGFWLFNLTRDIPGHPAQSTVTEATVERERRIEKLAAHQLCRIVPDLRFNCFNLYWSDGDRAFCVGRREVLEILETVARS